ncbi:MAG: Dabb family protein [Chitinispirillaceae bacterium]|nr:Dabb family protein [Chitinispirillaceae bacterium]
MIVHIVMWKCIGNDLAEQNANAAKIKELLDTLQGKVPQIVKFETGLDSNRTAAAYDVVLYSTFNSVNDLKEYGDHPIHKDVAAQIGKLVAERHVVDYEI